MTNSSRGKVRKHQHRSDEIKAQLKELYLQAINDWVSGVRSEREVLTSKQIGALEGQSRLCALRNGLVSGMIDYCRQNPRMDCAPALYALITSLSDNSDGYCSLGQARMGEVLGRKRVTITEAIKRLRDSGLIVAPDEDVESGKTLRLSPAIHPVFAEYGGAAVWFVNALSPERAKPGRPRNDGNVIDASEIFDRAEKGVDTTGQVFEKTCPVENEKPVRWNDENLSVRPDTTSLDDIPALEIPRGAAAATAAERAPHAAMSEHIDQPEGGGRRKGDLLAGMEVPKPATVPPEIAEAYRLLQAAFAIHGRHYEPSPDRGRLLRDLIASRGMAYVMRLAAKITEAKALRRGVLPKLQTNQIVENEEIRAKLFDGEYDNDHGEASASKPAGGIQTKGANKRPTSKMPPAYTPEFLKFWDACPASSRAKAGKEDAFNAFQLLSQEDRSDVMTVVSAGVWEEEDIDDARYAMSVKRWIEGESWVALAEMREISLYYFGRKHAAAAKEAASVAAGEEAEQVDEDEEKMIKVPKPMHERIHWLSRFIADRMPHDEIIRCHGHHLEKYSAGHLLTASALDEMLSVATQTLCDGGFEFFVAPGKWVDWELASRIEEATSSLFHGMAEVIQYHDGKCPRSWAEGLAERDGLDYGPDEWDDKLVPKGSKQLEEIGVR